MSGHGALRRVRAAAVILTCGVSALAGGVCSATPFVFNTGDPNGLMASASQPASAGRIEFESADDFFLADHTRLTGATFTGLLTGAATPSSIGEVRVEIYRVFPDDSNVTRTSGPPTFSTPEVPTRVNSPSDVEFVDRDTASGNMSFSTAVLSNTFSVSNTVQNGVNPKPNQTTGGDGPATGEEVLFSVTFITPIDLLADHYFFVPQVQIVGSGGQFLWLSAARPIVAPGTPFMPDLQSWIRNDNLAPDWLRIGTDVVGGTTPPAFNASFSLAGQLVPEPGTAALLVSGLLAAGWRRRARANRPV